MIINLQDVGEEGQEFAFKLGDEKEIDHKVKEVVEDLNNFKFKIFILKTGDIYTATGSFSIEKEDVCSLCGQDISAPLTHKFTEYLVNQTKAEQKGHAPHSGLNLETQQEVTFVQHHELDLAEFIAEHFAVSVSPYPRCKDEAACEERQKENRKYLNDEKIKETAFSALSVLKNKKN